MPYSNNNKNPYQNNGNPFDDDGLNKQRKILAEQQKLKYKSDAENALDKIVSEYSSAINNQIQNWKINISDKASITRYYKRYWDNEAFIYSIILMLLTFFISFYTKYASIGIFAVFVIQYFYSQKYFFRYFVNDHELKKNDIEYLYTQIFGYQFNYKYILLFTLLLIIVSFTSSFYTTSVVIDSIEYVKLIKILNINIQNELYAYINAISILTMISIKIVEKWK